ncbi:efflux RND transporter periplasmic adaptor subunit [Arhodomonas sp. AD133]|uniref:efflux RND transporter periplasmic adaptor subunit n=1 Tax=Arhodomonas sp. AD133 TaxID=3415009 RepID=UPI003EBF113A
MISRLTRHMAAITVVTLAVIMATTVLGQGTGPSREESVDSPARPVRVMTVTADTMTEQRQLPGQIQAAHTSAVSFQVAGRIDRFPVREGEVVDEGALIAGLDATDYRLALREAKVRADQLQRDLERKQALRADGHLSEAALDDTRSAYELARVKVDQATQNLGYTEIEAPFEALVAERLVDSYTNVPAGEPVALLQDVSALDVEVSVPEITMARVRREDIRAINATLSARPQRRFPLTLKEVATQPDPGTRTYKVTFSMDNPEDITVLPGMSATVTVTIAASGDEGFVVPAGAVATAADGSHRVWLYDEATGTVHARAVTLGSLAGRHVRIVAGLDGGETIAAAGAGFLAEGQRVRPVPANGAGR